MLGKLNKTYKIMSEEKLRIFLQNHPQFFNEECEIIYLLAEIRKIIEDEKKKYL